ncbi:PAAR domain-containing protein [Flavobacteriaceae bacterium]|jgi:uncharacterized Zn-binding protein involved in type VI secretion|nr:PAAR domain-containing protein [Flavobacteriaceae bacterium]MDA8993511.1 PAAR domain-containing protein [Flavobacteriaceae bacterium]
MGNPVAPMMALHKCDVPDAAGTHLEIPIFFPCSKKVKVMKLPVCLQGDQTLCLNRIPTPAGPVPIPLPNVVKKGSAKVKFEKKPVARKDDPMAHGGKINFGIPNVKIG